MVVNSLAFVMTYPKALAFLAAGIAAGIFNAIAGGGTLITFPVLLAFGVPALSANITSSVGIVPSYVGGIHGFRSELKNQGRRIRRLIPAALLGSLCGALLLLTTPATQFRSVAPWLVAFATVTRGALLMSDSSGYGITAAASAGSNVRTIGIALMSGASGDIIPCYVCPGSFQG